jgi:hypothetical protein
MKIKKEYIILIVIIIALLGYLFFYKRDRSFYQIPVLSTIERNDVSKIEITSHDRAIKLVKEGSDWKISPDGYLADADKVKAIIDIVTGLTLTALVSESENYEIYDLGEKKKINVKTWSKDELVREFDLGKAAASFSHTYVKIPRDTSVYHAKENFRRKFDMSVDDMRDKLVLAFETEQINEIGIKKGSDEWLFSKKESTSDTGNGKADENKTDKKATATSQIKWVNQNNEELDEAKIKQLISTLNNLKCDTYIEAKSKDDFSDPIYTLVLKGQKEYFLSIFNKPSEEDKAFPAQSSENAYPFVLPKWRVDKIMLEPTELLKKVAKASE